MCKSDQAPEVVAACKRLGLVHEDSLENRFPHNAQLERDIRTLEEIARSSHLSAGFEMIPDLSDAQCQLCSHGVERIPSACR